MSVDETTWTDAERVVTAHFTGLDGAPPRAMHRRHVPFAFSLERAGGDWAIVLVHGGRIVTERGVAALGSYLAAEEFLERRHLNVRQLLDLLDHVDAYPPMEGARNFIFLGARPEHEPTLEFESIRDERRSREETGQSTSARLAVFYPPLARHRGGGPTLGPAIFRRATLEIPADYRLGWRLDEVPG